MKNLLFIILFISVCLTGCHDHHNNYNDHITVRGSGELVSHEEQLSAISGISIIGNATVNVSSGDKQTVIIRAQQNVYDVLDIHMSGGALVVGVKENCSINTDKGIYVDIVTPASINNATIVGAGSIEFSGKSQESLIINITGAGNVKAFELPVEKCTVTISGAGNCDVNVSNRLNINISGTGTVRYKGKPEISQVIAGLGSIVNCN